MKKLKKDLFSSLRDSFPVLTEEEMFLVLGGNVC
jgi:natural product precursor